MENDKTGKKQTKGIITVVVLIICLCITTFALFFTGASVDNNTFNTGTIKVNLNDGKPVIQENKLMFQPGMTVKKDFFIENNGSWDVYYKLYFKDIEGGLADDLEITVKDSDEVLYKGKASEFTKDNAEPAKETLKLNEKQNLSIYFYYPEESENDTQDLTLSFDLCADVVQTKNNPDKEFN